MCRINVVYDMVNVVIMIKGELFSLKAGESSELPLIINTGMLKY